MYNSQKRLLIDLVYNLEHNTFILSNFLEISQLSLTSHLVKTLTFKKLTTMILIMSMKTLVYNLFKHQNLNLYAIAQEHILIT